jgi:hypothetical protein
MITTPMSRNRGRALRLRADACRTGTRVGPVWLAVAVALGCAVAAAQQDDLLPVPRISAAADAGDFRQFTQSTLDDEACMAELRRCCCCPGWDHYVIFDFLALQRCNLTGNKPLLIDTDTGDPVLTSEDLQAGVAPGVRLFYGRLITDRLGWEVGYTGVYGMFGQSAVTGDENISFPDPLGDFFVPADGGRATWFSTLNMAEANLFCYDCCEECGPCCRRSCHCSSWLAGFVWAGLDEQSALTVLCCDGEDPSSYAVRASTNYFGAQIGQWGRREWCRWAVDGWWKAALCGTSTYQAQDPLVNSVTGEEIREARSARDAGVGFIGGLNGSLIYRLTDVWGIRAGYNCYWLTNAALAPNQYDFGVFDDRRVNDNGGLFLHGANLGVEARW